MIPIVIQVMSASYCRVLKNDEHWDLLWDILSYSKTTKLPHNKGRVSSEKLSFFTKKGGKFGLGLLPYIESKLKSSNIPYRVEWKTHPKKKLIRKEDITLKNKTLEDYQQRILREIDKGAMRGVIQASTGSGKSTVGCAIIKKLNYPITIITVPTTNIGKGFQKTLEKDLGIPIGFVGDGIFDWKRITVCLYQSLRECDLKELNKKVELFICDECHLALDAIEEILKELGDVWYRFGLSATPIIRSRKSKWFRVTNQMGPIITKITDRQADKRVVNDVEAYMFTFKGNADSRKDSEKTKITEIYADIYRKDVILNERRCKHLCKMVKFAFKEKEVNNVLLLVDEYQEALIVKKHFSDDEIPNPVIAWSNTNNQEIIKDINTGKIKFCIATPVFSVGTDIPEVQCVILGSARKDISNTIQKIGRGRRKTATKTTLLILDCYDIIKNGHWFEEYSIRRMNIYKRKKWLKGVFDI